MRAVGFEAKRRVAAAVAASTAMAVLSLGVSAAQAAVLDPGPPSIESLSVSQVSSHRATLVAQIDPDQLETTFQFWVEYSNCQHLPPGYGECDSISVRKVGEGTIAAGPNGQYVSATATHLQGEYVYSYWVVATNSLAGRESAHQSFEALPAPAVQSESVSGMAPNPYELHATIDPHGQAVYYQFQLVSNASEYASELTCPELGVGPLSQPFCTGEYAQGALPIGRLEAGCGPREVSLDLSEAGVPLRVGSTYHYRVLVAPVVPTEDTAQWEGPPTVGADQAFSVGEDNVGPPGKSDSGTTGSTAGGDSSVSGGAQTSSGTVEPLTIAAPMPKLVPRAHTAKPKVKARRHRRHRRARAGRRRRRR